MIEKESGVPVSSNPRGNDGHGDGELFRVYNSKCVYAVVYMTPYTAVNVFRAPTMDTYHTISALNDTPEDRIITPDKLKAKISEYNDLNEHQRDQLLAVLMKYLPYLTKRPGKYFGFE